VSAVQVGDGVNVLSPGDAVAMEPGAPCWHCSAAREGRYNQDPDIQFLATTPLHCMLPTVAPAFCSTPASCLALSTHPYFFLSPVAAVQVGEGVHGLSLGDAVALEPGVPCWHCSAAREGRYNPDPDIQFLATPP
jgi:threonine dehydrogenase-like Zn-dependent dehydrogenase